MARKHISGRKYGKRFNRAHKRTKAINQPHHMVRGGFRL